ncbi:MAG: hypothetical protein EPN88_05740 [Bacteroidetes bacterium]|nr:MAG: hypothetical protein EPN88_05740 [Bacteroidota bacterium]
MSTISVVGLLDKFKVWVKNGEIQFLKDDPEGEIEILAQIENLLLDIKLANKNGELSTNLDWAYANEHGRILWETLASCALNDIDQDSKGNSDLFNYMKAETSFEDILYGLEPYYRDHTLHSLWVYFIGEYILRELIPDISNNLNWHLINSIENEKASYSPTLLKQAKIVEKETYKEVNKKKDAIWCIIALCHDLGYSLSKLENLNEKALSVLKFYDMPNFRHIGYSMDIEHQHLMTQFLELMSFDIIIVPSLSEKEVIVKCYRDDSTFWRLCRAIEKKQHGIYSSYLLYKVLGIFADTYVRGTADEWGLNNEEINYNIIRGDILFSIAQHEFDFAHLNTLSSLADLLVIADELEEFSRFGRQLLSRKYIDTLAETKISFSKIKPKQGDDIQINMDYEVAQHRELANFFILKAERLCEIYSLDMAEEKDKYCTIKEIKMTASKDNRKLEFHLSRNSKDTKGYLPETEIENKKFPEGYYDLKCLDDKILVKIQPKPVSLEVWFGGIKESWWKKNYSKI